ncbi:transglutaminase family protein [soil metagenome]|jgi:transglutaminase-like putative cysteine protease
MKRYSLTHTTRYEYEAPVERSYGRAHLKPGDLAGQRCLNTVVEISPAPSDTSEHVDYFGNISTFYLVRRPHTTLIVTARSEIEVSRQLPDLARMSGISWEDVRDRLAQHPAIGEYSLPSDRIRPSTEVADYARTIFLPRRPMADCLEDLYGRIYSDFTYKSGATTVRTTLAELLELREGVCQDFAHLAVGCLRSVGLAGRYISGYIETRPAPGKQKLQGADASHAWAATFVPELGWVDLDPTNNQWVDDRYLVTACGRDYGDVPPLKGIVVTDSKKSTLQVSVDVVRL